MTNYITTKNKINNQEMEQKMNKPEVFISNNLDVIIENPANRGISQVRVERLAKEIHKYKTVPALICTEQNILLDGHHRLDALRLIKEKHGYTPYFSVTITKDSSPDDIALYNKEQVSWKLDDWVNFYGNVKGIQDYLNIIKYREQSGWSSSIIAGLATRRVQSLGTKGNYDKTLRANSDTNRVIKAGDFEFENGLFMKRYSHILKVSNYIRGKVVTNFAKAMLVAIMNPKYDMNRMERKAELCAGSYLKGLTRLDDFINALEDIYNYSSKTDKLYFTASKRRR